MKFIKLKRNDYQRTPITVNTSDIGRIEPCYRNGYTVINFISGSSVEVIDDFETITKELIHDYPTAKA